MEDEQLVCHSRDIESVAQALGTNVETGLSAEEAARRLEQYGPNALREKPRPTFWKRLFDQLNNFLVWILIAAALVSFVIGLNEYNRSGDWTEFVDSIAIMTIVALNAILGLVQEGKAEEALAALQKMAAPNAQVVRDGHQIVIPAADLVPGDLVVLETGNHVPADVRLIESVNLRIDEASLTGESVPVEKEARAILDKAVPVTDRINCGFMGTTVTYGRGRGLVAATGMKTQIGQIAELIQTYGEEPTPLQRKLDQLGRMLGIASLVICGVVGVIGIVRDPSFNALVSRGFSAYLASGGRETLLEMFMVAVSLAIAAVPEGLPAVVTICLALGMQEMVRRHALIRRMPAVETLGSTTTICSDKTGTLTQSEMMVVRVVTPDREIEVTGHGYAPEGKFRLRGSGDGVEIAEPAKDRGLGLLLRAGLLCNDARLEDDPESEGSWAIVGDPTEASLVVLAAKAGFWATELSQTMPRVGEVPFDSERKRMSTIHQVNGAMRPTSKAHLISCCHYVTVSW